MLEPREVSKGSGEAMVIRPGERPLFAFHHTPPGPLQRNGAIVLCPSIGYESLCAYRTYRDAADLLAHAGFHVLRFDYYGTGNSAGSASAAGGVVNDVCAAIDAIKARAQVDEVCLFGVRAGALCAVAAATLRSDVSSIAVWGTPASGRAYIRELRAFQAMSGEHATDGDQLRVAGFLIAPDVAAEFSRIDTMALSPERALRALVLRRDDIAGEERIAQRWSAAGHDVSVSTVSGYAAMMSTAESSIVPVAALSRLCEWAELNYPTLTPRVAAELKTVTNSRLQCTETGVAEEGVVFGPTGRLFGVLSERQTLATSAEPRRAVVILNTGANHHIGAGRFSVTLARALAAECHTVMRFDLTGIGESRASVASEENALYARNAQTDVAYALRFLREARQIDEFIFVGVCAGAYAGMRTALTEPRVVGQVLVNLAVFEPAAADDFQAGQLKIFKARHAYVRSAMDLQTWRRLVTGDIAFIPIARHLLGQTGKTAVFRLQKTAQHLLRREPVANEVEAGFRMLSRRAVRSLLIYSRNDATLDTLAVYLGQQAEVMRNDPNFALTVIDDADHTFTWPRAPQRLLSAVVGFVRSLPSQRSNTR